MSTSTLPRIREAQKKAEDCRYYMLRANRQMTTLALGRIHDQLESERVDFNARVKQEALELKMELLRRAEEEKAVLKADENMLYDVNVKIAKRRKKRADEQQMQRDRKREIKRRVEEKRKDKRFDPRRAIVEESAEAPVEESSGGGHRPSILPVITPKKAPNDLDIFMPPMTNREKREPKIKLNLDLIFPNARKPQLYKQLTTQNFQKEVSRINEKSLRKLQDKYRALAAAEEASLEQTLRGEDLEASHMSSVSRMMSHVAEDSRHSHLNRILRQVNDTRDTLRFMAPRLPLSDRLKQSLEECVRRRKKKRRRGEGRSGVKREKSTTVAKEESTTVAREKSTTVAREKSTTVAREKSTTVAREKSTTVAREKSTTVAREKSTTVAGEKSTTVAKEESTTVAGEKSTTVAGETSLKRRGEDTKTVSRDEKEMKAKTVSEEGKTVTSSNGKEVKMTEEGKTVQSTEQTSLESSNDRQDEEEPREVLNSILTNGEGAQEKVWRLPASSRPRADDSAVKRVTLKGPNLTPIQSTETSPQSTREPTRIPEPAMDNDEAEKLDPAIWKDVMNCRYIRGYEPPEMRIPASSAAEFIFGEQNPADP